MSIFRVGVVTLAVALLGAGAIAIGVALDPGAQPARQSAQSGRMAQPAKALSAQQQQQLNAAKERFVQARRDYDELKRKGAPAEKLETQRAKVEEAGNKLWALAGSVAPRRMAGGGCSGSDGGGCSMGKTAKGAASDGGGCSMEGGCSMGGGAKAKGSAADTKGHDAGHAASSSEAARGEGEHASHTEHATGRSGAAVSRGGDAAGHDGSHSSHGGAAKALGTASTDCDGSTCSDDHAGCTHHGSGDCDQCTEEHAAKTGART